MVQRLILDAWLLCADVSLSKTQLQACDIFYECVVVVCPGR